MTFGGSGLDRAAHLRGDAGSGGKVQADPAARAVLFWRGKPLCNDADAALVRLPLDHPVLSEAVGPLIFLGLDGDIPVFAADISGWEPDAGQAQPDGTFFDPSVQRHPACDADQGFVELRGIMTMLTARDAELAATGKALHGWHRSHRFCACCGQESRAAQAGWQRDCPACGASHFPRTDPVVIMLVTRGNALLLGRSPGWPEGMYSCLAGFVEPGEPIEAAVRREVFEEAGIRVGRVRYLAGQPWPYPSSLMFGCHGEALDGEITLDPVELEDAIWVTREELAQAFAGEHPVLKPARKGAIAQFLMWNWLADRLD